MQATLNILWILYVLFYKHSTFYILALLDFLVFTSATVYSVAGAVYLFYHALIQKTIKWSDFNLQDKDWELLQIGLVLFFLQVSGRKTVKQTHKKMGGGYTRPRVYSFAPLEIFSARL